MRAVCTITPEGKPSKDSWGDDVVFKSDECHGEITITKISEEEVEVEWDVSGLTPGEHGVHIHEKADFSKGCTSAGAIYNPHGKRHGAPGSEERHVGDLGNIVADASGRAKGKMTDRLVKLDGDFSVIGRSFMLHADPDDLGLGDNSKASEPGPPKNGFVSKVTGNVGARVGCGEIQQQQVLSQAELLQLQIEELRQNQLKTQRTMGITMTAIFIGGVLYAQLAKGIQVPEMERLLPIVGPGLAAFFVSLVVLAVLGKMCKSLWDAAMTPQGKDKTA